MSEYNDLLILLGGVAFFMYGMDLCSRALERIMANRVRFFINRVSKNSFLAILVGISLTVFLQSSGAVTSMLVNLGSAGVIVLSEVMGIIIGTAIGSTLTIQIISFDIDKWGLVIFLLAFTGHFISTRSSIKRFMTLFMGLGLLFFGMDLIGTGALGISQVSFISEIFQVFSGNPWISLLTAAAFSGFVHSSAVTIGLAMGFTQAGMIQLDDALFWVLGANVGTTSTALMAAAGGNYIGKQVAWANFLYRVLSAFVFFGFVGYAATGLMTFSNNSTRAIANAHLLYNVLSALIFLPFIKWGVRLIEFLIPQTDDEKEFGAKYLKRDAYKSIAVAETYASREIMRMADIVLSMIRDSLRLFQDDDPELRESIEERDDMVDQLFKEIKDFLLGEEGIDNNDRVSKSVMGMVMFASDLERAADIIDHAVLDLARKKNYLHLEFSDEGWKEIKQMHREVMGACALGVNCFVRHELAEEVIVGKRRVRKLENKLRKSHVERLNLGMKESINTSSIHLDLLSEYRRVSSLIAGQAYKKRASLI